jgi:hypothetical protein
MFSDQAAEKLKKIAESLLSEVSKNEASESPKPTLQVNAVDSKTGSADGNPPLKITGEGFFTVTKFPHATE